MHRFLLLTGPRKCGKTIAAMHKILRHCFDTPHARVAMFSKTTKNAKAGGVWVDMTEIALPVWLDANIGMRLVEAPKVTGDTRMSFFRISNRWGQEVEVQLHSLEYCPDIVDKIKGTRFSMIYFSELDLFEDRVVFDISEDQLRIIGLPYEFHQWIGDCNPPDSGPNNWQHDLWFKEADRTDHPDPEYQAQIKRIQFALDDNPFLDPREKRNLIAKYRHRQSLYNRFILGIWEEDLTDGFFADVFSQDAHVMGSISHPTRAEWEVITPSPGCHEIILGIDPGQTNHAATFVEKIHTPSGEPIFAVLDEVVSVDRKISLRQFTEAIMSRVNFWQGWVQARYNRRLRLRTWSDTSIYSYNSAAEVDESLLLHNLSGGLIQPMPWKKFAGSVDTRVRILHRLLQERRIFFSAQCVDHISMVKSLKKGTSKIEPVARTRHKHPFDALTYILINEEPTALEQNAPRVERGAPSRVILVG